MPIYDLNHNDNDVREKIGKRGYYRVIRKENGYGYDVYRLDFEKVCDCNTNHLVTNNELDQALEDALRGQFN